MSHDEPLISIPNMIRVSARRFGDAIALVDDGVELTYRQLETALLDSTRAMIALGVKPGDRVALCGPNTAQWILAAIGILGAGAALVPVNTRFKGGEIGHLLTKSAASAFITVAEFMGNDYVEMVRAAVPDAPALKRLVILDDVVVDGAITFSEAISRGAEAVTVEQAEQSIAAVRPEQLSDVMFTSGTTGAPKGVMLTHAQSMRAYSDMGETLGVNEQDCILIIPPFFHTFGYKAGWMMGFMFGLRVVPQRTFQPEEIMQKVHDNGVSCVFGPPTIFVDIMAHPSRAEHDLSSLRVGVVSAASIPVALIGQIKEVLGFELMITGYGLTEASALVTLGSRDDDLEHIAGTAGRAVPGVTLKTVDEAGNDLKPGEAGELLVHGYNVMSGYWGEPEETAKAITSDGWLRTGDIGVIDDEGYVTITDRKKDMFIVGGFNAYPAEIENILSRFDKILHVAVIGVADARMGEVGAAFVVPRPGVDLTEDEVIEYARANLANFKVPRVVHLVDDLPRNASLKVLKHELRDRHARIVS
jgi:acyl-CoA synthetase (AMP-forming)/AMP-acid ligase II